MDNQLKALSLISSGGTGDNGEDWRLDSSGSGDGELRVLVVKLRNMVMCIC